MYSRNAHIFSKSSRNWCEKITVEPTKTDLSDGKSFFAKRKMSTTAHIQSLTESLSPYLFWNIDKECFDAEKNSAQLIKRVLEYGELNDWRTICNYYGLDRIANDCKTLRTLRPEALSFVCVVTDTKKEDYRCYNFRQSFPTLWNS